MAHLHPKLLVVHGPEILDATPQLVRENRHLERVVFRVLSILVEFLIMRFFEFEILVKGLGFSA